MSFKNVQYGKNKNSTSQMKQSFPKDRRMNDLEIGQNTEFQFGATSTISPRATSLGYGSKMDISAGSPLTKTAAFKQSFRGSFEDTFGKQRGNDFGTPRNRMVNTLKNNLSVDKLCKAGPGDYDTHSKWVYESRFKKSPSFGSVGQSTLRFNKVSEGGSIAPGPQQYKMDNMAMQTNGVYFFSKFKSSGACKINPGRNFSKDLSPKNPSPDAYTLTELMPKDGKQQVSKFGSSGARTFGKSQRKGILSDVKTPGPGAQSPCTQTEFNNN